MPMTPLSSLARPTRRQIQAGFSLIEILVAIVVISLGLLGLAGLQAASLRNNQVAYFRSIASQQAYDMMDRMRVNLAGVRAGNYNDLQGLLGTIWSANPNLVPVCIVGGTPATCTAAQLATEDYRQWRAMSNRLLPNGGGTVCLANPATGTCATANSSAAYNPEWPFVITVTWNEKSEAGTATQTFVTRFRP